MFRCDNSVDRAIDGWAETGDVVVVGENAGRKHTCDRIVESVEEK